MSRALFALIALCLLPGIAHAQGQIITVIGGDPHQVYDVAAVDALVADLQAQIDALNGGGGGPIEIADVNGLQDALDGKSATGHTHVVADVSTLQATLDGITADIADRVISGSASAVTLWAGSQAAYDQETIDPSTVYIVVP